MSKLYSIFLIVMLFAGRLSAQSESAQSQIAANLGNVYLNGLPKLAFDLGTVPDLARLGILLRMEHHAEPSHAQGARTRWDIPSLRTCIYPDKEGNLTWIRPGGQFVRFRKTATGFARRHDSLQIRELGKNVVEITSSPGLTWVYKGGFLESISSRRLGTLYFMTDREYIFKIVQKIEGHSPKNLLQVVYSEHGKIEEVILPDSQNCKFQWSSDHLLLNLRDSQGNQTVFSYNDGLLAGWHTNDQYSNSLRWAPRKEAVRFIAFGRPPVVLLEDSYFKYRHGRTGSISILRIHTQDDVFVSETRFNSRGVEQRTPAGVVKAVHREIQDRTPATGDVESK